MKYRPDLDAQAGQLLSIVSSRLVRKQVPVPVQGDHSPGKPGKVREFQSGEGKVREMEKSGEVKSGVFFKL